jgi:hypothetical protein
MTVENAVAVYEKHEQVVVPTEIVFVNSIDEAERLFLAVSFAAMRKTRDRYPTATVGNVNTPWERFERYRHTQLFDRSQVELVLVLAIKRKEDMQATRRIFTVGQRVHCA